ncbi:MAG: HAD family hydrolase [Candidatus Micrarchaeota archaeon]
MSKAVFLDRDGTINEEVEYLNDHNKFRFMPGSIKALEMLQKNGYRIILVTNQSGIAKGKISKEQLKKIHDEMKSHLSIVNGIPISDEEIYHCPHNASDKCDCRKPNVKNFKEAEKKYKIDPSKSYVIGDKTSDIEAGRRGGYKTILVQTGYAGKDGKYEVKPDFVAKDLLHAAKIITGG